MASRKGKHTIILDQCPSVLGHAAVVGKAEGEGPMGRNFDIICDDSFFGEKTWEKAESRMLKDAVNKALEKCALSSENIDYIFSGDLLNQCIASTYGLREMGVPHIGLYGACSTMAESLGVSSVFVETGAASNCVCATSSHFCSAERQFRLPLEYGGQRTPTSQWTATAAGAAVVGAKADPPYIKAVTFGAMKDMGIKDPNNMGAAMAPAAADTIQTFLDDTQMQPSDFDLILTGDLGQVGSELLLELMKRQNIDITRVHSDCGLLMYDRNTQDVMAGGSGCGCSASIVCSYILNRIKERKLINVLFAATGALMSTTSSQQGESIPGISHLVWLSANPW